MVLHLNVALNEPGSGIVHQDGSMVLHLLHSDVALLGVALCIKNAKGVTPECCTQ